MIVLQILAFAVFSFGIFKTEHQGAEQDRYIKLSDQLSRVDALSFKYTAVDASLRTYNASPSIDTLEQLVAQLDTTKTEVEILRQTLGSASNIIGKLAELNTTLNAFDTDVVALKQAQTKFKEANTSLRDIGDEQIKQTKAVIEAAYAIGDSFSAYLGNLALIDAMKAQTFVRDFLATGNPELLEDARALLATSADNVSQIIQRTQNKPYQVFAIEVEKLLSGYVTVIDQLTASRTERRSLYSTIDSHNITARSILAQLVQQTAKADTTNRAELAAKKNSLVLTFAIASSAVLLFGLISSAAFVAHLRRDISSSISAMMAVADGDFDLEVSGLDRKNELGQIARALDVLRKEGARAKELTLQNTKEANKRIELEQANAQQRETQLKKERQ
jgi:methyl-accepting chemotaxis protein